MELRAVARRDRDRVLALANRETSWQCGLGSSHADDVHSAFEAGAEQASRLLESNGAVTGFARVAPVTSGVGHFSAIASERHGFVTLVDWACSDVSVPATLRTSVASADVKGVLDLHGFTPYLVQRTMALARELAGSPALPAPCRFADFESRWLAPLLATYVAAWPDEVDVVEAERTFRESDGLVLAVDAERVAGYVLWERVDDAIGVIHEVAVHPDCRRRGMGSALTRLAIGRLRPLTSRIELLVVGRNPARLMYERLGFEVVDEVEFLTRVASERSVPCAAGSGCA
ncbi:MAG: N-acetyltransferase [Gammaproteobacteria bacterium]|nr:N-acetyltransferase [Gammaproteobacteria bacterium]